MAIRRARNLSQEGLADVFGCHRTYVGGLERGERNVSLRVVERFAAILGVVPVSLLVEPADLDQERPARSGPAVASRHVAVPGSVRSLTVVGPDG